MSMLAILNIYHVKFALFLYNQLLGLHFNLVLNLTHIIV